MRLMFNLKPLDTCRPLFRERRILTVACIFIFKCVIFVKNNVQMFEKLGDRNSYNTRFKSILSVPIHKTSFFEESPHYSCLSIYNRLPVEFQRMTGYRFRKEVKKFLIDKAFYTLREYFL